MKLCLLTSNLYDQLQCKAGLQGLLMTKILLHSPAPNNHIFKRNRIKNHGHQRKPIPGAFHNSSTSGIKRQYTHWNGHSNSCRNPCRSLGALLNSPRNKNNKQRYKAMNMSITSSTCLLFWKYDLQERMCHKPQLGHQQRKEQMEEMMIHHLIHSR